MMMPTPKRIGRAHLGARLEHGLDAPAGRSPPLGQAAERVLDHDHRAVHDEAEVDGARGS